MEDERQKKYQSKIDQKCPYCFRKDECMLLPSQRATLCLGPFKDDEDWARKIREDNAKEEGADREIREAALRRLDRRQQKDQQREEYLINRMLCDLLSTFEESKDDD